MMKNVIIFVATKHISICSAMAPVPPCLAAQVDLTCETGYGNPSGHVMVTAAVWGFLCLRLALPPQQRDPTWCRWVPNSLRCTAPRAC